jgi:hypothetical protein
MSTAELIAKVTALGFDAKDEGGRCFLREDVAEPLPESGEESHDLVWSRYCDVLETLGEVGLAMRDPYLEHDCITGEVVVSNNPAAGAPSET